CGPPSPAPANAVLSPESYQKMLMPSPASSAASVSSSSFWASIILSACWETSKISATSVTSCHTSSNSALSGASSQPNGDRYEPIPDSLSSSRGPTPSLLNALEYDAYTKSGLAVRSVSLSGYSSDSTSIELYA